MLIFPYDQAARFKAQVARRKPRNPQGSCRETRVSGLDLTSRKPQDAPRHRLQIKIGRPSRGVKLRKKKYPQPQNNSYSKQSGRVWGLFCFLLLFLTRRNSKPRHGTNERQDSPNLRGFQSSSHGSSAAVISLIVSIGCALVSASFTSSNSPSINAAGCSCRKFSSWATISSRLMASYL